MRPAPPRTSPGWARPARWPRSVPRWAAAAPASPVRRTGSLGEYPGPAAGFASGAPLDVAAGGLALMGFAGDGAGGDDAYGGGPGDRGVGGSSAGGRGEARGAAGDDPPAAQPRLPRGA